MEKEIVKTKNLYFNCYWSISCRNKSIWLLFSTLDVRSSQLSVGWPRSSKLSEGWPRSSKLSVGWPRSSKLSLGWPRSSKLSSGWLSFSKLSSGWPSSNRLSSKWPRSDHLSSKWPKSSRWPVEERPNDTDEFSGRRLIRPQNRRGPSV